MTTEGFDPLLLRQSLMALSPILLFGQALMSKSSNLAFHLFIRRMGLFLIIEVPLIFREASADFGMKSSGNILWEVHLHEWKRTSSNDFQKKSSLFDGIPVNPWWV
jgi:hypothetical protein